MISELQEVIHRMGLRSGRIVRIAVAAFLDLSHEGQCQVISEYYSGLAKDLKKEEMASARSESASLPK